MGVDVIAPEVELTPVAEALRRVTVRVLDGGGSGGAGVIWRARGSIVTNAHVARGPRVGIELLDGRAFEGRVLRRDPRRDLALVEVEATDLPAAVVGNSDALRIGELVLAIGHPFGLPGALAVGVVHAIVADPSANARWIQADIRLAPGNSGGPLSDAGGRVIGINAMIAGGLALAVSSRDVEQFLASVA